MNAWRTQFVGIILAVVLGAIYGATLAPGPVWGDGLEFASVIHVLGIPHPTGYPLYVMLGKVWTTVLPLGSIAWRLNLLSAVWGVVAALLLFLAVRESMPASEEWEDVPRPHHWRRVLIPAGTALAWGLTPAVWQSANVAEVYTLFAVFLHGLVWLMLRNLRRGSRWNDAAIALLLGLSLTHHRLIVVLVPAVIAYFVVRWRSLDRARLRWVGGGALAFLLGLTPLLYLPLRAAMNPPLNWGDPSSLDRFLWVLRGGEFVEVHLLATAGVPWVGGEIGANVLARWDQALRLLLGEFVPLAGHTSTFARLVTAAMVGLMALGWWRSRRALRWSVPMVAALNLLLVGVYNIADFQSYLLPAICAGWFWIAFGLVWFAEAMENVFLRRRFTYTALVLGLLPAWLAVAFWPICDRSNDERADHWATRVLEPLAPNALLLTRGDGDTYALWYAQHVDGLRPDVTVFGSNFMWNEWYRGFFPAEEAASLFFEELTRPPDPVYYLMALVGGVFAPNLAAQRPLYTCFNPYQSPGDELVRLWPQVFDDHMYEIGFLGHTRDPDQPGSAVGPPDNPLLPPGWADSMRRLGEPSPQVYCVVDNPTLTHLARDLFERWVTPGHDAWRQRAWMTGAGEASPEANLR